MKKIVKDIIKQIDEAGFLTEPVREYFSKSVERPSILSEQKEYFLACREQGQDEEKLLETIRQGDFLLFPVPGKEKCRMNPFLDYPEIHAHVVKVLKDERMYESTIDNTERYCLALCWQGYLDGLYDKSGAEYIESVICLCTPFSYYAAVGIQELFHHVKISKNPDCLAGAILKDFVKEKENSFLYGLCENRLFLKLEDTPLCHKNSLVLQSTYYLTDARYTRRDFPLRGQDIQKSSLKDYLMPWINTEQRGFAIISNDFTRLCMSEDMKILEEAVSPLVEHPKAYDKSLLERVDSLPCDVTFNSPAFVYYTKLGASGLNISLCRRTSFTLRAGKKDMVVFPAKGRQYNLFFPDTSHCYFSIEKGRFYPLTLKQLFFLNEEGAKPLRDFFRELATMTKNYLLLDYIREVEETGKIPCVPLTYEHTTQYHNKKEFFTTHYNNGNAFSYPYNRRFLQTSYILLKAFPMVDAPSREQLRQYSGYIQETKPETFLLHYLTARFPTNDKFLFEDYLSMARRQKVAIRLNGGMKYYIKTHDDLAIQEQCSTYWAKNKRNLIPKDSRFLSLREKLPKEFEWITTAKRLIEEGTRMKHCVVSYHDEIEADETAIYSFYDEKGTYDVTGNHISRRYTIQFIPSGRKGYQVVQLYSACNEYTSPALREYITKLVA